MLRLFCLTSSLAFAFATSSYALVYECHCNGIYVGDVTSVAECIRLCGAN